MIPADQQSVVAAQHEAAHAVARVILGASLVAVEVNGWEGYTYGDGEWPSAEIMARASMAGPAVENRYYKASKSELIDHWTHVYKSGDEGHDAFQPMAWDLAWDGFEWATQFIEENWPLINKVADELRKRGRLTGDEVRAMVNA